MYYKVLYKVTDSETLKNIYSEETPIICQKERILMIQNFFQKIIVSRHILYVKTKSFDWIKSMYYELLNFSSFACEEAICNIFNINLLTDTTLHEWANILFLQGHYFSYRNITNSCQLSKIYLKAEWTVLHFFIFCECFHLRQCSAIYR